MTPSVKIYRNIQRCCIAGAAALLAGCADGVVTAPPAVELTPPAVSAMNGAEQAEAATRTKPAGEPGKLTVALLLPLSGPDAEVGQALLNAAQMALFDVGQSQLKLIPRDTRGAPDGAARAAQSAIDGGAELILGPLFSTSVSTVAPIARDHAITMLAFSTDRSVAGDGVYILGFVPEQQVRRVIGFARGQGIERFAALVPDSPYGHAVLKAFGGSVLRTGAEIKAIEFYQQNQSALFEPVKRLGNYAERRAALMAERRALTELGEDDSLAQELLKQLAHLETLGEPDFDAVFMPEGGALLRALAPLLPYYEIDPLKIKFLGTGLWDDPGLSLEPSLIGSWFAGPPPNSGVVLSRRFLEIFGREPPRITSLAYDAVALAAVLSRADRWDRFDHEALTNPNGFAGIDGIFRFLDNGVAERGLAVIEVTARGFVVLSPAPTTFQPAIN
ncbi:MAG: penicillin-binding protein activator [Sphingomonadales bacterium]